MQFRWNLQLLTRYSYLRNLHCFTANILIRFLCRSTLLVLLRTTALDMPFDRIEHTTGPLQKIKFYFVNGKTIFLIERFLSSRKLWVVLKYKSTSKGNVNHSLWNASQFYLGHLSFYSFFATIVCLIIFLRTSAIWADDIALNSHVTSHLTCCNKLISKLLENISNFHQLFDL